MFAASAKSGGVSERKIDYSSPAKRPIVARLGTSPQASQQYPKGSNNQASA